MIIIMLKDHFVIRRFKKKKKNDHRLMKKKAQNWMIGEWYKYITAAIVFFSSI